MLPASPDWPRLHIVRGRPDADRVPKPPGTVRLGEAHAEIWILAGDRIDVDRETLTMRLATREPVSDDAVLHPYLGLAAAVASHWLGRRVLHGGAFHYAGRSWGLLGEKGGGKSSTLAALHQDGHAILSDDLIVLDGTRLLSGPRCIDLREDAADVLGGRALGVIGDRRRWRLRPGGVPPSGPLGGLVQLEWGDEVRVEPLTPEERLATIIGHSFFRPLPGDELPLLEVAALPGWRFVRPQRIETLDRAVAQLLEALV